jgi:hypothetical protein
MHFRIQNPEDPSQKIIVTGVNSEEEGWNLILKAGCARMEMESLKHVAELPTEVAQTLLSIIEKIESARRTDSAFDAMMKEGE